MWLLMRGKVTQAIYRILSKMSWREIVAIILFHYLSSWALMLWAEPGAEFVQADTFWYFYFITATTVGYGDFSPATFAGRMITVFYICIPGIAMIGVIIGKIGAILIDLSDKLRRGLMSLHLNDHTIVVGDGTGHTVALLRNLIADSSVGEVVLVSSRSENPMNGQLAGFVSGDINDAEIQAKACFKFARRVIVLGEDDTTVTGRTIVVMDCSSEETEILAYFNYEESARRLGSQTDSRVRTVSSVSMDLVVQEALDPGAGDFVQEILRNGHGGTYLRLTVPEGVETTWVDLGCQLMRQDISPMALYIGEDPDTIPKGATPVRAGDTIAVAAVDRTQLETIDWSSLVTT